MVKHLHFRTIFFAIVLAFSGVLWLNVWHNLGGNSVLITHPINSWLPDSLFMVFPMFVSYWLSHAWVGKVLGNPTHDISKLKYRLISGVALSFCTTIFFILVESVRGLRTGIGYDFYFFVSICRGIHSYTNLPIIGEFFKLLPYRQVPFAYVLLRDFSSLLIINFIVAALIDDLWQTLEARQAWTFKSGSKFLPANRLAGRNSHLQKKSGFLFFKQVYQYIRFRPFYANHSIVSSFTIFVLVLGVLPASTPTEAAAANLNTVSSCRNISADVVALDQTIIYNRLGVMDPEGMIFALRSDVVDKTTGLSEAEGGALVAGNVQLRSDKRPRPLTLRMNVGDCLSINFQNLLSDLPVGDQPASRNIGIAVLGMQLTNSILSDGSNVGRNAAMMGAPIAGLVVPGGTATYGFFAEREGTYEIYNTNDDTSVEGIGTLAHGLFGAINVEPRGAEWYRSQVTRNDMDLATPAEDFTDTNGNKLWDDTQAESFTDTNGNQIWDAETPADTFTDVNANGIWETGEQLLIDANGNGEWDASLPAEIFSDLNGNNIWDADGILAEPYTDSNGNGAWDAHITTADGHPVLNYDAVYPPGHKFAGKPILKMLDSNNKIIYSDLTAVITGPGRGYFGATSASDSYPPNPTSPNRDEPFREFTIIFHDEIAMTQAFPIFDDPEFEFTLHGVRDGKGINYGTGGIAAEVLANRLGVGPSWNCPECKLEEFFLTSWALGDPSMIVDVPANTTGPEPFQDLNGNGAFDAQGTPAEPLLTDNNINGIWDPAMNAEPFTDLNDNHVWEAQYPAELFTDVNGDGQWNDEISEEDFIDLNGNDLWDAGIPAEAFDDANGNAAYDEGEIFTDANSNNVWDAETPAEPFTDTDGTGVYDAGAQAEPFIDVNHNDLWDSARPSGETFVDENNNGLWDTQIPADTFTDLNGNSTWDTSIEAETFTDTNNNGIWDIDALITGPKATKAFYPDDPSNVYHTYIGDHTKFRNLHVGKEHHIFHLHSHQWLQTPDDDNSTYLDSQAIGPGSSYTYEIAYGGSGNRNKTPGDAIFHCHFYPHFAQGMWAMWRGHDVFERGTELDEEGRPLPGARALPDGEIVAGTPIPGVVPLPAKPMAPMPGTTAIAGDDANHDGVLDSSQVDLDVNGTPDYLENWPVPSNNLNPGFPFYIPGVTGHRPPTPALDMTDPVTGTSGPRMDGGLPRHVITGGEATSTTTPLDLTKVLDSVSAVFPAEAGTPAEQLAMQFHAQHYHDTFLPDGTPVTGTNSYETNGLPPAPGAPFAEPCRLDDGTFNSAAPLRVYKAADIQLDMKLSKLGWHFPQARMLALWQDVGPMLSGKAAPQPFVMRANSGDCINYYHTNLIPGVYEQDAYQVRTPTDVIGQHIHLVKFDVTASDGSGNGYNYEDGTLSPDEVRERIAAIRAHNSCQPDEGAPDNTTCPVAAKHPFFGPGPNGMWLGARTTIQRWWADPVLNNAGQDRTLGNVYTHDHYGPSTHQQTGLYATLTIEPAKSFWRDSENGACFGNTTLVGRPIPATFATGGCTPVNRDDGGPTSWRADILTAENAGITTKNYDKESFREFYFEFSDFQHAYAAGAGATFTSTTVKIGNISYKIQLPAIQPDPLYAINPAGGIQNPSVSSSAPWLKVKPTTEGQADMCPSNTSMSFAATGCPEAISTADVGTFSVNYRTEPVGARILDPTTMSQSTGDAGDLSLAFSSSITRADTRLNIQPNFYPPLTADVKAGDPYTPMIRVYEGDRIRIKVQVGATEEGHNASLWGGKWLQEFASPNSGWRASQMMGISEQFNFDAVTAVDPAMKGNVSDYIFSPDNSVDGLWNGVWNIMRSYSKYRSKNSSLGTDLLPLPNNRMDLKKDIKGNYTGNLISNLSEYDSKTKYQCPLSAPKVTFNVTAVLAKNALPNGTLVYNSRGAMLQDPTAILYVRSSDLDASGKLKAGIPIEPLILRARAGDCITLNLKNNLPNSALPDIPGYNMLPSIIDRYTVNASAPLTARDTFNANDVHPSNRVGLRPQMVAYDTTRGAGNAIGSNSDKTVPPGSTKTYYWYAGDLSYNVSTGKMIATPIEFGATNLISSDPIKHSNKGAVGALIIEPQWSVWKEDATSRASANIYNDANKNSKYDAGESLLFRDFVLIFQDDINMRFGNGSPVPFIAGEDDAEDSGMKGLNYRSEPLWYRLGIAPTAEEDIVAGYDFTYALANSLVGGDPQTPVFTANIWQPIRLRVLQPNGHPRNHVFALHGHVWQRNPYTSNCTGTPCLGSTIIGNNPYSEWRGAQEGHGPTDHWDIVPQHGAGGFFGIPGDYLYRDMTPMSFYNGIWGLLRVTP